MSRSGWCWVCQSGLVPEKITLSSSVNAMRFKLLKPRTQGGLHISVIAIVLFFCSSENCSFSPFSLYPLVLFIPGLHHSIYSSKYEKRRSRLQDCLFFMLSCLWCMFLFCLKIRPVCVSLWCKVMWLVLSFLFSECGIIKDWHHFFKNCMSLFTLKFYIYTP